MASGTAETVTDVEERNHTESHKRAQQSAEPVTAVHSPMTPNQNPHGPTVSLARKLTASITIINHSGYNPKGGR